MTSFSIIIASSGRETLNNAVASVLPQLAAGDELIVDVNNDAPWGNAARNRQLERARGDYILFMDDDDEHTPDALAAVRLAIPEPDDRVHLFRMRYNSGYCLWAEPEVRHGNVSTQMVAVPRTTSARYPPEIYEGDFFFIDAARAEYGEPVWHEHVIALIRPTK